MTSKVISKYVLHFLKRLTETHKYCAERWAAHIARKDWHVDPKKIRAKIGYWENFKHHIVNVMRDMKSVPINADIAMSEFS